MRGIGLTLVCLLGSGACAKPTPATAHGPTDATSTAPAPPSTLASTAPPPASAKTPKKPALAIRKEGDDIVCEGNDRCRFGIRSFSGELQTKTLAEGATVEYGKGAAGTGGPELAALLAGIERSPSFLGDEKNDRELGAHVPIRVRFADGEVAEGKVPLSVLTTRVLLNASLSDVARQPISVPNDAPHSGKPRAMWVSGGHVAKQPYGSASTLAELDWILVVDDNPRKVTCPKGNAVTVSDTRGRVYDRRTGKVLGQQVVPTSLSATEICSGESFLSMRDGEQLAVWAWNNLR
jgi:hypothetical protein